MRLRGVALPFEQPQARVSIDGAPVAGLVELQVDAAGYFAAGRFRAVFALGAVPGFGAGYFVALTNQNVQIDVAPSGFGYATLLLGRIDSVRIDWLRNTATISGRDLTGLLIDAEIAQSYVNQTASQIAATIAGQQQLTPNVTATSALVGQYYQLDHAQISLGVNARVTTAWELLVALALAEGFGVSVTGQTLNFGPVPDLTPVFVTPGSFSALAFDLSTALPGAATVKSWNCKSKSVVSGTQGSGLTATIVRPNLTAAQAKSLAQEHLHLLGQHQLVLQGTMPADVTLMPGMPLMLAGTGSALDQTYVVDAVTRRLGEAAGFAQTLRAHAVPQGV